MAMSPCASKATALGPESSAEVSGAALPSPMSPATPLPTMV